MKKLLVAAAVVLSALLAVPLVAQATTLSATYRGHTIEGVKTTKKVVAFDFDDGPIDSKQIIDVMQKGGAQPTFFWVGSRITSGAADYAVKHHVEINSHSYQHKLLPPMNAVAMRSQIASADERIEHFTGKKPLWFRAPFNSVSWSLLNLLADTGHLYAHQYLMTRDYDPHVSVAKLVKIFDKPKPGAIYLFHEGEASSLKALPTILKHLRAKGFRVVSNTELLKYGPPVDKLR